MNKINKYQTKSRIIYCIEKVPTKQAQLMNQHSEKDSKILSCNKSNLQNSIWTSLHSCLQGENRQRQYTRFSPFVLVPFESTKACQAIKKPKKKYKKTWQV